MLGAASFIWWVWLFLSGIWLWVIPELVTFPTSREGPLASCWVEMNLSPGEKPRQCAIFTLPFGLAVASASLVCNFISPPTEKQASLSAGVRKDPFMWGWGRHVWQSVSSVDFQVFPLLVPCSSWFTLLHPAINSEHLVVCSVVTIPYYHCHYWA